MSASNGPTRPSSSKFLAALQALGCNVTQQSQSTRIEFRYQGGYYLAFPSKAGDVLCVMYPAFLEVANFANAEDANTAIHELNAAVAIARIFILEGDLCASAETLVSDEMDIEQLFVKLIGLIQNICIQMRVKRELSVSTAVTADRSENASASVVSGMALH